MSNSKQSVSALMHNKTINIKLSTSAQAALHQRKTPLLAEMELYFSCLVRKQLRFHEDASHPDQIRVNQQLAIVFKPVMTDSCRVDEQQGDVPPITTFPIKNPAPYVPHWLHIDFRQGSWQGEFGYAEP